MDTLKAKFLTELRLSAQSILRSQTPFRTGNLRNSIKSIDITPTGFTITIGGEQAPYVIYVNEPWLSPKWKGRENPREQFIARAAEMIANYIGSIDGIRRVI